MECAELTYLANFKRNVCENRRAEMITKLILIDNHKLFREGIKRILDYEESFEVIAEGSSHSTTVLDLVETYKPDVILMDNKMSSIYDDDLATKIIEKYPSINVIILSDYDDDNFVTKAIRAGVKGYLLKEMDTQYLIEVIKIVSQGCIHLHPNVTSKVVQEYRRLVTSESGKLTEKAADYRKPLHLLTRRECEVLQLLADGKSNKGVAEALFISEKTVKNHVSNILQKMNVNDRTQAVVTAIRNGWVDVL